MPLLTNHLRLRSGRKELGETPRTVARERVFGGGYSLPKPVSLEKNRKNRMNA
jgi:hypothetical protein